MFIRLFSRFFLHRFSYTIFKRSIEPHSNGNSLNNVCLDSPIIQQYSFLIINTAEKDRLLSQLITGTLKKKKWKTYINMRENAQEIIFKKKMSTQ